MDTTCKMDDTLAALESARKALLARGATGISLFVHTNDGDTGQQEYQAEMLKYLRLMNKESTVAVADA